MHRGRPQSKNRYAFSVLRVISALSLSLLPLVSDAQTDDEIQSVFQAVPFSQWIADGPKQELPWKTRISHPKLSLHQRIVVRFQVMLDGNDVAKQCCGGRAIALLQITDFQGQIFRNDAVQDIKGPQEGLSQYIFTLAWDVFLLPGDYQVATALYYTGRPGYNVTLEKLHVNPVKDDPLPQAWRDLPNVEFCDPQPGGVDEFLLPRVTGQLNLPIKNHGPIRVEILENLTPYPIELRNLGEYNARLGAFISLLKSLSQMQLTNGSLNVATMDFTRNSVTFEQKDISGGHLDLAGLKDALAANPVAVVNARTLGDSSHYWKYFGQAVTESLRLETQASGPPADRLLPVLIVVSGGMELGRGHEAAISPPPDNGFLVYYLHCEFLFHAAMDSGATASTIDIPPPQMSELNKEQANDEIGQALKHLKPRVFPVSSAEQVRKAMAAVIRELSRM